MVMVSRSIYIIGICGTGVGALAGMLKQLGHQVSGSDEHVYPPMSTKLQEWGIPIFEGYNIQHLQPKPDLVVVGNVIRATNVEAVYARKMGLPTLSMPEAIAEYGIGDKHSIVVTGTHGKTTTTAMLAHVLMQAGTDPSFLVGGALIGYAESFRVSNGPYFAIEGDEYDTAYFDKGPKFWHYKPKTAIITSLEYDHADIYPSIEAIENSFKGLIQRVPSDGHFVVWHGAERARRLIREYATTTKVITYASSKQHDANLYLREWISDPEGLTFYPVYFGRELGKMQVPLWGDFSAQNVLAVIGALLSVGIDVEKIREGLASFQGVRRRLEVRGEVKGITVVDDFAHHPTAVLQTLAAARTRWPKRRLWTLFEPRSATSRRNIFQSEYVEAFLAADKIVIAGHARLNEVPEAERFSPHKLAHDLVGRGCDAESIDDVDAIVERVGLTATAGDVVLVFSNGDFGGLHGKLIARLERG
jgi:UDP-N-acetylmuramate: L-alanyl-gamma-D-glutamyl-meso-diaminopimelate ligase